MARRTRRTLSLVAAACCGHPSCGHGDSQRLALPPIVAHRGASSRAPENTLAAFELAWELGADRIEGDFFITRDGVIVAHHDPTTERTAGVDRPIESQTLAELAAHDVGSWKDAAWAGERIPTLEAILRTVPEGKAILIELKSDARIVTPLMEVIDRSQLALDQLTVISFDADTIAAVKAANPAVKALWVSDFEQRGDGWHPMTEELIATARRIGADGVDVRAKPAAVNAGMVDAVHAAGLEFHVWTVNDPALFRRMANLGVDSITTDRPGWMREQLTPAAGGAGQ